MGKRVAEEQSITITAPYQEVKAVGALILAYRKQCRFLRDSNTLLALVERFHERLIKLTDLSDRELL